jgi:MinD-like ATPase involved in chromosome partitioning or flagellar assembly
LPWTAEAPATTAPATGPASEDDSPTPTSPWSQPIYRPNAGGNGPNGSGGQFAQPEGPPDRAESAEAGLLENQPIEGGTPGEIAPSSTIPSATTEQPVYFPADPSPAAYPGLTQPAQPEQPSVQQPDPQFFDQMVHQPPQPSAEEAPPQLAPWQSTAQEPAAQPGHPQMPHQPYQQQPYQQQPYQQQPYEQQQQAYEQQQPYERQAYQQQLHEQQAYQQQLHQQQAYQQQLAEFQGQQQPQPGSPAAYPEQQQVTPRVDEQGQYIPTAEEFARRREVRPSNPIATMGLRGAVRRSTFGLVRPGPGKREQEHRHLIETIRRNFGGLRQVTVVNPKGGAGKTVAVLLLAMTFGQSRGGYVLSWDNNETQGTLGMRATQDFHSRTVRDLMRDLDHFQGAHGRVGDLSQYVRSQGEGMFDVLASDESATAGEMLTAMSFSDLREVVSRFYKLIFVDTGNNVRAENWQAAIDATDQLVVTMSARNDSAETAARMLDHLEQNGRNRLVRQAVTVVSMPPSRRDLDIPSITRHFSARTRTVMLAPYEKLIDSGEPIRYGQLSAPTRLAWLRIGAAVAEGL